MLQELLFALMDRLLINRLFLRLVPLAVYRPQPPGVGLLQCKPMIVLLVLLFALLVLLSALLGRLTFNRFLVRLTFNRFLVRLAPLALRQPRILQCDLLGRARRRKLARQLWAIIDDGEIRCLERQNYREFFSRPLPISYEGSKAARGSPPPA